MYKFVIKGLMVVPVVIILSCFGVLSVHAQVPGSIMTQEIAQDAPKIIDAISNEDAQILPFDSENSNSSEELLMSDPCPEPKAALENTPSELKKIQEDITRFNLCLQRAQLLARLNDLALENLETINTSIDKKIEEKAMAFAPASMPDISAPEFPDVAAGIDAQIVPEVVSSQQWYINEIKGKDNRLVAVLSNDDQDIVNVTQGDIIPETEITVESISQTGVITREAESTTKLKWKN